MHRSVGFAAIVVAVVSSGGAARAGNGLPAGAIRPPDAKTDMDENAANLASAVITHAFGQLPEYIDAAKYRLLPFDVFRSAQPGVRTVRVYRLTCRARRSCSTRR